VSFRLRRGKRNNLSSIKGLCFFFFLIYFSGGFYFSRW
jgi:hypothetical protein